MSIFRSVVSAITFVTALVFASGAMAQTATAVPRAGFAFSRVVTVNVTVDSVDTHTRTIVFTLPDGNFLNMGVSDQVKDLDKVHEGGRAAVTYHEVVTILNLKRKGEGSRAARNQPNPTGVEADSVRFTYTVVAVDHAKNQVSLIGAEGGQVRTVEANSPATLEAIKTMKVGDVLIGLSTPLLVTRITAL